MLRNTDLRPYLVTTIGPERLAPFEHIVYAIDAYAALNVVLRSNPTHAWIGPIVMSPVAGHRLRGD